MILHLVTDRRRLAAGTDPEADPTSARECLLTQTDYAIDAGIDYVQVREPDLGGALLADLVTELVRRARGSRTQILVNDRLDVAVTTGAHGVHLRGDSISVAEARRLAPPPFIVGRSVHSLEEAAAAADADYLIAGTVWRSASKPAAHALLGPEGFSGIARAVRTPVLAIGGVTVSRARTVAALGGAGIAAIGLFMNASPGADCRAESLRGIVAAVCAV